MVVNGYDQYQVLQERMLKEPHVWTPIYRDQHLHPAENELLCTGVTFPDGESFVVSQSHPDAEAHQLPQTPVGRHSDALVAAHYEATGTHLQLESYFTPYVRDTLGTFWLAKDLWRIIPLTLWGSMLAAYHRALLPHMGTSDGFTYGVLKTLQRIEASGIAIDREKVAQAFGDRALRSCRGTLAYSQYNPFTATGRPSNRFGGINYSALNKSDGTREAFISRYPDGWLVQLDFEAYHLRLIASHLGIDLPDGSIHREMAKVYFGTEEITQELYEESKRMTFNLLYGVDADSYGFELFERVFQFRKSFAGKPSTVLPSGVEVVLGEVNSYKLFNYFVQSLEVVRTMPKLQAVLDLLEGSSTKLVMYTYDSILLDMEEFDTNQLAAIQAILEEGNFPVRLYRGRDYGNLSEIG